MHSTVPKCAAVLQFNALTGKTLLNLELCMQKLDRVDIAMLYRYVEQAVDVHVFLFIIDDVFEMIRGTSCRPKLSPATQFCLGLPVHVVAISVWTSRV